MLLGNLFMVFAFFTHKQNYAWQHFTGGKAVIGHLLCFISFINLLIEIAFLICIATKTSIISAILWLLFSFVFIWVVNRIICKIVIRQAMKSCDIKDPLFFGFYNYKCDVATTIIAEIGVIANIIIATIFVLNFI